jgi:hypothetical protein
VTEPVNVFISYSHNDEALKDQLLQHLSTLMHERLINVWHDRDIDAGDYWITEIDNHIELARIILLLVSPSFVSSRYCYSVELERVLELQSAGRASVIPIILRPVDWKSQKFSSFQALPIGGRPVTSWKNRDEAFLQITVGLRSMIEGLSAESPRIRLDGAPRAQPVRKMRYYLYVSDSKVNMLFAQLPPELRNDAMRKMGVQQSRDPETDRISKLEVVERFIREQCDVGSADSPAEYIAGTQTLAWGCTHGSLVAKRDDNPFVFFSGGEGDVTLLMSGSSKHLIGDHKPRERGFSSSSIPHVIETLMKDIELESQSVSTIDLPGRIESYKRDELPYSGEALVLAIVDQASSNLSSARQRLEFLAKTLLHGPSPTWEGRKSVLASPLYVALAM